MQTTRTFLIATAMVVVVGVILLDVLFLFGLPAGPLALAQVLAAHLTVAALIVIPIAALAGTRWLRVALVLLLVTTVVRFGGEWWSPPAAGADGPTLTVATLNLEIGSRAPADAVAFLRTVDAGLVALQELTPDVAAALDQDPVLAGRYPHRALYPTPDVFGLGVLSAYPLTEVDFVRGPSRLLVTATTPAGPIRVIDVHPLPGRIALGPLAMPIGFDTVARDAALDRIRETVAAQGSAVPILVLGDINTAPTEPEFARFVAGFADAHADVGVGPGWTYRPSRLETLGIGLIRIDVVLAGPGLRPITEAEACPPVGDHCLVRATLQVGAS